MWLKYTPRTTCLSTITIFPTCNSYTCLTFATGYHTHSLINQIHIMYKILLAIKPFKYRSDLMSVPGIQEPIKTA